MPPTPALLPPDAGPSEPSARCRGTVAYLFLLPGTVREPFALPQTWGEYFAGCEEGEATVHLHAQGANDGSWLAAQGLPFRVDSVVADPVQGELRFNFTMQEAMLKLWAAGANATATQRKAFAAFAGAIAERYSSSNTVLWELINERKSQPPSRLP